MVAFVVQPGLFEPGAFGEACSLQAAVLTLAVTLRHLGSAPSDLLVVGSLWCGVLLAPSTNKSHARGGKYRLIARFLLLRVYEVSVCDQNPPQYLNCSILMEGNRALRLYSQGLCNFGLRLFLQHHPDHSLLSGVQPRNRPVQTFSLILLKQSLLRRQGVLVHQAIHQGFLVALIIDDRGIKRLHRILFIEGTSQAVTVAHVFLGAGTLAETLAILPIAECVNITHVRLVVLLTHRHPAPRGADVDAVTIPGRALIGGELLGGINGQLDLIGILLGVQKQFLHLIILAFCSVLPGSGIFR